MQYRVIYNNFISPSIFALLIIMSVTATADTAAYPSLAQDSPTATFNQYSPDYYMMRRPIDAPRNPWVLPPKIVGTQRFEAVTNYSRQSVQANQQMGQYRDNYNQRDRFVTPEILESLRVQQQQLQTMPDDQSLPSQVRPQQPAAGVYAPPTYNMGSVNPLYDVPVTSPWASGSDVLYRGQSFSDYAPGATSWLPNEAVGGLPPMPVPAFGAMDNTDVQNPENVFNPFNFMPNRSIK